MRDKALLADKNILFTNSCSHFTAKLAALLCEMGANIMIADKETKSLERFRENFSEQRELYPHFGRIALINYDKTVEADRRNIFQSASEAFGGINCWLDLQSFFSGIKFSDSDFSETSEKYISSEVSPYLALYKNAIDFLNNKRKSSVVRLVPEDLGGPHTDPMYHLIQAGLQSMQNSLNFQKDMGIHFLNIKVGPTEDYLLARYPDDKVNEAFTKYQQQQPQSELIDADEIATSIAFLIGDNKKSFRISNLSLSCTQ